jgi:SAM-dependent methyltransferase
VLNHTADDIPLDDDSADSAVITYTLCSIPDPERALREIARVLKPSATLLFCEHGAAPDASVRRWQNRLTPYWKHVAGGCHLDRDIPAILRQGGFKVQGLETMYLPGWRPGTFNYWGSATP